MFLIILKVLIWRYMLKWLKLILIDKNVIVLIKLFSLQTKMVFNKNFFNMYDLDTKRVVNKLSNNYFNIVLI